MSKRLLQEKYPNSVIKKVYFKCFDFLMVKDDIKYHIKILNINKNKILSINSLSVWEIKSGKLKGINFKTGSTKFLDMRQFNELPNKVVILKKKPYKILKYINESEVVDISDNIEINSIEITCMKTEINS